jgi:putative heme-binding domain-containing protein
MRFPALLLAVTVVASAAYAQPPGEPPFIAPTGAKTPADERKAFKLLPGFEAQLVASEPDIQKPIQMAFDAKGRLWVTTSHHYPFPAPDNAQAHDKLFVLSDFGTDGKAKTVKVFADNLNIPIGILPLPDCNSCIVSSVGRILKLTDTDGDGKADKTEELFTGFGMRDTHGMTNSYTLMPDGWVYACHGYSNSSHTKGKDGHEVAMQSGNTFRFRPDGSRIEVYTHGQVNPFGIAIDPWFNLYTADCHTKPITQLIRGAYYDSFGKPHDGLGYAPHVARHSHGSTALCGLTWYDADQFPKEYLGTMFLGNVVTSRINFDRIEWKGSTPVAIEQPDFLVSGDPWFRPTDIKLGPDGALYVSDFYNRIIGHYEVDLKHPLRDKDRGRVWRIVWKGEPGASATGGMPPTPITDLTTLSDGQLTDRLRSSNLTIRHTACQQLISRGVKVLEVASPTLVPPLTEKLPELNCQEMAFKLWIMLRLRPPGRNEGPRLFDTLMRFVSPDRDLIATVVRGSAMSWEEVADSTALGAMHHWKSPRVERAALDTLTAHPNPEAIGLLAAFIPTIPAEDTHLRFAARVALRNSLACDEAQDKLVWLLKGKIADKDGGRVYDDVFLGVPSAYSGWWFAERINAGSLDSAIAERAYEHVGRYGCDVHRTIAADSLAAIQERRQVVARLAALGRGVQAAASSFVPDSIAARIRDGLTSKDDEVVRQSLELAAVQYIPAITKMADAMTRDHSRPESLRVAALKVVLKAPVDVFRATCQELFQDANTPLAMKEQIAPVVAASGKLLDLIALRDGLKTAPHKLAVAIAVGLSSKPEGADLLFAAIKAGQASPRLLQEKLVLDRLRATKVANLNARVKELTAGLPSVEARLQQLMTARAAGYVKAKHDIEAGKKVYANNCAACHQIAGQGGKVGPNIDGVGNRGLERVLEDVLDPNRNVDVAFRATMLNLSDGRQLTGMLVREEGAVYVLADAEGKEQRIPKADVDKRVTTAMSPMPANFGEKIKEDDFYNLMAYLLELRAK